MQGFPHYFEFLWICVAASALCTFAVTAQYALPAERWIDHRRVAIRWSSRIALFLAGYLPFLACTWIAATAVVGCCTAFMHSIPIKVVQVAVATVPLLLMFVAYTFLSRRVRARSEKRAADHSREIVKIRTIERTGVVRFCLRQALVCGLAVAVALSLSVCLDLSCSQDPELLLWLSAIGAMTLGSMTFVVAYLHTRYALWCYRDEP